MSETSPCIYCGNPVAPNAWSCPQCGGRSPYPHSGCGCATLLLVMLVLSCGLCLLWPVDQSEREEAQEALVVMQGYVEQHLDPGPDVELRFQAVPYRYAGVEKLDEQRFRVRSYVDIDGRRTHFRGEVARLSEDEWRLVRLELPEGEAVTDE